MGYNNNNKKPDDDDDSWKTVCKVVGALAGVGFAAWGADKLFSGPESSSRKQAHASPPEYPNSQGHPGAGGGGGGPFIPNQVRSAADQWCCPAKGWLKLNADASCKGEPNPYRSVAIGGVFMDDEGDWVIGFAGKIPSCDIHEAELYAIKEGLQIAWENGFKKIEVESDCDSAVRLFYGEQRASNDLQKKLVQECENLYSRNWTIHLKHINREANKVAHEMSELGHAYPENNIRTFKLPPDEEKLQNRLKKTLTYGPKYGLF